MHPSHYGRMCPIETPEGPNIGLIGYLVDATRGSTGSASSRRRTARSSNGVATDDIEYLAADDEDRYVIAQANAAIDDKGRFLDDKVLVRAASRRGRVRRPARGRLHGRVAEADRLGGDRAHPVPRARRRQPRAHGRQHAAPGRPAPAGDRAVHRHRRRGPCGTRRRRRHPRQGRRHRRRRHRRHRSIVDYEGQRGRTTHRLSKFRRSNQGTCINQKPRVDIGDTVLEGDGPRRRPVDPRGRARARQEPPRGVHAVEGPQLRGRDRDLRAPREGRRAHVDPHRGARDRRPRHQARCRGDHARHPEPLRGHPQGPRRARHHPHRRRGRPRRHPRRQGHAQGRDRAHAGGAPPARDLR